MKKIFVLTAILSLLLSTVPVFAWRVNINADVWDATAAIGGAGSGGDTDFSYSVAASGGIIDGSGNINLGGGGSDFGGGMGVEISGSGADGDLIFATHDLTTEGCCYGEGCTPCPPTYLYDASSVVTVTDGDGVEIKLKGGGGSGGAGQKLKAEADFAGSFDASMSSSLTVGEETESHTMGAYGDNVWFKSFGKQGFDTYNCDVGGFFMTVMGYGNPFQ